MSYSSYLDLNRKWSVNNAYIRGILAITMVATVVCVLYTDNILRYVQA